MDPQYQKNLNYVFKLLSYRSRTEKEIIFRLQKRAVNSKIIDQIIIKLKKLNFINDTKFCLTWQSQRDDFKPRSARLLKLELAKLGVDKKIIDANIDSSLETETKRAKKALKKKLRNKPMPKEYKQKTKYIAFLFRRGFSWGIIKNLW